MGVRDSRNGYGWISIALHWLTGALVVALWWTGSLAQVAAGPARYLELTRTHMTIALGGYALLWLRVVWRLRAGHPGQGGAKAHAIFRFARWLHYALVATIATMLVSGPLMVWSGGGALRFMRWSLASPFGAHPPLYHLMRDVHGAGGTLILVGVLMHVVAVILHVAVMRDGSFDRIMVPGAPDD